MKTSQLVSPNNALANHFIKQIPSLIPSGHLEAYISPRHEQDARTARAEVLWFKTLSVPVKALVLHGCTTSMEVEHPSIVSTDCPKENLGMELQVHP